MTHLPRYYLPIAYITQLIGEPLVFFDKNEYYLNKFYNFVPFLYFIENLEALIKKQKRTKIKIRGRAYNFLAIQGFIIILFLLFNKSTTPIAQKYCMNMQ